MKKVLASSLSASRSVAREDLEGAGLPAAARRPAPSSIPDTPPRSRAPNVRPIAEFASTTAWRGRRIVAQGDQLILEQHGAITPNDVMNYDRQGHLIWENPGTRAWIGARALRDATAPRRGGMVRFVRSVGDTCISLRRRVDAASESRHGPQIRKVVLAAIGVLVCVDVVLVLVVSGAIPIR
jgi:hypothetical protein